jgi:hypothetical protein
VPITVPRRPHRPGDPSIRHHVLRQHDPSQALRVISSPTRGTGWSRWPPDLNIADSAIRRLGTVLDFLRHLYCKASLTGLMRQ